MNNYKIQHKILTLAECAVMEKQNQPASFSIDGVEFSHWDFSYRDGWITNAWLATSYISAKDYHSVCNDFRKRLSKLIPRISLISQSYVDYLLEPFLIHKTGSNKVFFRYTNDVDAVGLMFTEDEQKALNELMKNNVIPEEFYYYWKDAVNTTGYSAKLLLMFSATEALAKRNGRKDWSLMDNILGNNLVKELFGTKAQPNIGLRHRLVHGEYFNKQDQKNYLVLVHNKIINYFNKKILSKPLIHENVTNPQRNFFGNKEVCLGLLEKEDGGKSFDLKDMLKDFSVNGFRTPKRYRYVSDKGLDTY